MKKKEIIIAAISVAVMAVAIYFMLQLLSPSNEPANQAKESETIPVIPTEFDEKTYQNIQDLSDYGLPSLDNIGKSDLFANF